MSNEAQVSSDVDTAEVASAAVEHALLAPDAGAERGVDTAHVGQAVRDLLSPMRVRREPPKGLLQRKPKVRFEKKLTKHVTFYTDEARRLFNSTNRRLGAAYFNLVPKLRRQSEVAARAVDNYLSESISQTQQELDAAIERLSGEKLSVRVEYNTAEQYVLELDNPYQLYNVALIERVDLILMKLEALFASDVTKQNEWYSMKENWIQTVKRVTNRFEVLSKKIQSNLDQPENIVIEMMKTATEGQARFHQSKQAKK